MNESNVSPSNADLRRKLARRVLAAFILTFVTARIVVIFIMAGMLPHELFFHVKGTHVHHLNYGIFLLSICGGVLLFAPPGGKRLSAVAGLYGVGLALTFDEFGMWLHLGGAYWQRASYDAVVTIAALLALIAYGATIRKWRPHHVITAAIVLAAVGVFAVVLSKSLKWAEGSFGPRLYELEERGPS